MNYVTDKLSGTMSLLFTLFHLSLQCSKSVDVTESCRCSNVVDCSCLFLLGCLLAWCLLWLFLHILECAAVRKDDTLCFLNELDNLELELLAQLSL